MGSSQSRCELTSSTSTLSGLGGAESHGSLARAVQAQELWNECSEQGVTVANQGLGTIHGELLRQTRSIQRVANLTYEEFLLNIKELNHISSHFLDTNGKQLVFAVKKGTDSTLLWKATVRVACVKIDADSKQIESYRTLTLKQFVQTFHKLKNQADAMGDGEKEDLKKEARFSLDNLSIEGQAEGAEAGGGVVNVTSLDECCICLERKPELILPCAHSYCLPCIEQWNVDHKTCPVCRETLSSTSDGWVISEGPDSMEIATEIQKSLMSLAQ